jgi:hypothetical protein
MVYHIRFGVHHGTNPFMCSNIFLVRSQWYDFFEVNGMVPNTEVREILERAVFQRSLHILGTLSTHIEGIAQLFE